MSTSVETPVTATVFAATTSVQVSVERERAAARAAGYAAGWSAGAQAAHVAVTAQLDALGVRAEQDAAAELGRLRHAATALEQAAQQARAVSARSAQDVADAVLDAALQLAGAVLGHEPLASTTPGRDALARALAAEPSALDAVAHLHPADAATVSEDELAPGLRVVPDPTLQRGDAVLDHAAGRVEVLLADALARARAVLLP